MIFNFDPGASPTVVKTALRLIPETTTLFQHKNAADLTLKKVATMREAVACGGIMLMDHANGRWLMVAGETMYRALAAGVDNLGRVHKTQIVFSARRHHLKKVQNYSAGPVSDMGHTVVANSRTTEFQAFLGANVTVLGVLTKAHGHGYGLTDNQPSTKNATGLFYKPRIGPALDAGWSYSRGFPSWPENGFAWEPTMGELVASNFWTLSAHADLGVARQFMKANGASIFKTWRENGALDPEIEPYYVETFQQAVDATFTADERATAAIPFLGGSEAGVFESDARVVTGFPHHVGTTYTYTAPSGTARPLTEYEAAYTKEVILVDFGHGASAPILFGKPNALGTSALAAKVANIRLGSALVPVRELLATVTPRAALQYEGISGVVDVGKVMEEYSTILSPTPYASSGASLPEFDAITSDVRSKSVFLGDCVYLGPLGKKLLQFSSNWDQLAQDSARSSF